jgi:hypothetical protein
LGLPEWFQLPFVCPDGAYHGSRAHENVLDARSKLYFGWNKKLVEDVQRQSNKKAFIIEHPWAWYVRTKFPNDSSGSGNGTLFFWPHANEACYPNIPCFDRLIEQLKSLSSEFHPITICLNHYDISTGLHKKLRKYGLPIVTAGNNNSTFFVNRFFNLIAHYNYFFSSDIGSQVMFTLIANKKHFIIGEKPQYIYTNKGSGPVNTVVPAEFYNDVDDQAEFDKLENILRDVSNNDGYSLFEYAREMHSYGRGITVGQARTEVIRQYIKESPRIIIYNFCFVFGVIWKKLKIKLLIQ